MKLFFTYLGAAAIIVGTLLIFSEPALAQSGLEGGAQGGIESARGTDQPAELFGGGNGDGLIRRITDALLFIVGVISVIMIIIGGLRFVVSGGDKAKATAARNTILYAILGLLVAFFSYAIIEFVVGMLTGESRFDGYF